MIHETHSPTQFFRAFDSLQTGELETDQGTYAMLRSTAIPHQRHLPFGCSEAITVHYLPRITPDELARLQNAQVPVGLLSEALVLNGATLFAANLQSERRGVTTSATAALLAWGHASGYAARFANTDEAGATLRAAVAAWESGPNDRTTETDRAAVMIAAAAVRFGSGVEPFAYMCQQCAIANPTEGASDALGKIDSMLSRTNAFTLTDGGDVQAELDAFAKEYSGTVADRQQSDLWMFQPNHVADTLSRLAAATQGGVVPIPPVEYAPLLAARLRDAQKAGREFIESKIRADDNWLHSPIQTRQKQLEEVITASLVKDMDMDRCSGILPAALSGGVLPSTFHTTRFVKETDFARDLGSMLGFEVEQLQALDLAMAAQSQERMLSENSRRDRIPFGRIPPMITPMMETGEDVGKRPLSRLLSGCKPGALSSALANPKNERDGFWAVLSSEQTLPLMLLKTKSKPVLEASDVKLNATPPPFPPQVQTQTPATAPGQTPQPGGFRRR